MLLDTLKGEVIRPAPLWMMRQAGRALPSYRELRKNFSSFLEFVFLPQAACEATLLPLQEFPLIDAAILFSDILVIPYALGQEVTFVEGKGPILTPLDLTNHSLSFSETSFREKISPVFETLRLVREKLPPSKTLIGFAGAPWTVAVYMLEGEGSRDFLKAKKIALSEPVFFEKFLNWLTEATIFYLKQQIQAGAQVLQIFESWASVVPAPHYKAWIEKPTRKIVDEIKKDFPHVPIIGFPKGLGVLTKDYVKATKVDAVSLDSGYPLEKSVELDCVIQGNLDPSILVVGGEILEKSVEKIYSAHKGRPFIFNLGHGVIPSTPFSHIKHFVELVKRKDRI